MNQKIGWRLLVSDHFPDSASLAGWYLANLEASKPAQRTSQNYSYHLQLVCSHLNPRVPSSAGDIIVNSGFKPEGIY
jgi:hypothetical protein